MREKNAGRELRELTISNEGSDDDDNVDVAVG